MKKTLITLATIAAFTVPAQAEVFKVTHPVTASPKADNTAKAQAYLDQFTKKPETKKATEIKDTWSVNKHGLASVLAESPNFHIFGMVTGDSGSLYFMDYTKTCYYTSGKTESIFNVNGQNVKFEPRCSNGKTIYLAKSKAGSDYVLNEFKRKNSVKVGEWVFSARGFTKAYNQQMNRKANAL